jgi:Ca-activated chloride channel family protein
VTLGSPLGLLALLGVPLALLVPLARRRAAPAVSFTNLEVLAGVTSRSRSFRSWLPPALGVAALAALGLALARPELRTTSVSRSTTVVLAVDTSGSMQSTDVLPTRLAATKRAALAFLAQLPASVRVGVVSFDQDAQVVAFPTRDRTVLRSAIGSLEPGSRTALGEGLARSLDLVRASARPARRSAPTGLVLLLSDGRNNAGLVAPLDAAQRALAVGVPVDTVALGTNPGIDASGMNPYADTPDPDTLAAMADATGGRFFSAATASSLTGIYRGLGSTVARTHKRHEATVAFVALGAALLAGSTALALAWRPSLP